MTPLLVESPWLGGPSDLRLPGGASFRGPDGRPIRSGNNQVILWSMFVRHGQSAPLPGAPRFAMVIDSGFGDTLVIRQEQLEFWIGSTLQSVPKQLSATGIHQHVRVGSAILPKYRAHLLALPNLAGYRDIPDPLAAPVLIRFQTGIVVWPTSLPGGDRFRLPLLGMLGLREVGAHLEIDGIQGVARMSV